MFEENNLIVPVPVPVPVLYKYCMIASGWPVGDENEKEKEIP